MAATLEHLHSEEARLLAGPLIESHQSETQGPPLRRIAEKTAISASVGMTEISLIRVSVRFLQERKKKEKIERAATLVML